MVFLFSLIFLTAYIKLYFKADSLKPEAIEVCKQAFAMFDKNGNLDRK
jgi:hypothetical protein